MKSVGLLVKIRGDGNAFAASAAKSFGPPLEIETILRVPAKPGDRAQGVAPRRAATWLRVRPKEEDDANPWDLAHALLDPDSRFAAAGVRAIEAIEPDLEQPWPTGTEAAARGKKDLCTFEDQDTTGRKAKGPGLAWNVGDDFSELAKARDQVGDKLEKILIAHLDTGYDAKHVTLPAKLRKDLQRNFVKGGQSDDATDQTAPGNPALRTRGHGTGTLSLLAGNKLDGSSPNWPRFKDYVGGAPLAQIIPIRIADWVVRFTTGTMVQGIDYARTQGVHVLSMSMGGLSSQALVDAVNLAYEAGVVMVTAGGNNLASIPSPKSIVFPARYRRVLAACGVMADGGPYAGLKPATMQGNFGPASKMSTALGAYTPNVPWAQIDCEKVVHMDGAGTSSATPQIAAAAALWLAEHWDVVSQYSEPWMRVEAVRHALFTAAAKTTSKMNASETLKKIGQGVLKADGALAVEPLAEQALRKRKLPPAEASWSWVNMIFGGGVSLAAGMSPQRQAMLALELTQMAQQVAAVDEAIDDPERAPSDILPVARHRYLEAAFDLGNPSKRLRQFLETHLGRKMDPGAGARPVQARPAIKREMRTPPQPTRRLRVFALDPSIGKSLQSMAVNETTLTVPWEDLSTSDGAPKAETSAASKSRNPAKKYFNVAPLEDPSREAVNPPSLGPVGEYLEVVDIDPASNKVYDPVNLNDPKLLGQDGWAPSEGNPQFHQQMVYAVGMTTIGHFEEALGRRALWAPRYVKGGDGKPKECEVQRLRMYPHALRTDNAYYSPEKKALLFGYFPADSALGDGTAPGSMVFTCLSSDIIAHEMSHALLDGLHRRFEEASNPDVPAFHEAFADIVALFQHFTFKELVRFEIGRVRGDLTAAKLLAGLAKQFGEGSGRSGPLRDYVSPATEKLTLADAKGAHDRGSMLVYAVYEAFRAIVGRRTEDLIRLATGGTGVLPEGALHPGLVNRLTEETCKGAKHLLRMCIRALDYCPAVDITFGDYLRALITSDLELVPNDRYGYRVAFMEAFRKRGILPLDARTFSEEALSWNTLVNRHPEWAKEILNAVNVIGDRNLTRSEIFQLNEQNSNGVWRVLNAAFAEDPDLLAQFGLMKGVDLYRGNGQVKKSVDGDRTTFDVFNVRPARRVSPDGTVFTDVIVTVHQRRPEPIDGKDMTNGWFWFRGGATLIMDARKDRNEVRYSIIKNSGSVARLERQRQMETGIFVSPLHALYFNPAGAKPIAGGTDVGQGEPFALMHLASEDTRYGW